MRFKKYFGVKCTLLIGQSVAFYTLTVLISCEITSVSRHRTIYGPILVGWTNSRIFFVQLECISGSLGVSIGSLARPRSVKIRNVAWHTRLRSRRYDKAWKLRKCSIFFKWTSANDFKLAKWFLIPAASTMYSLQHIHMLKFHISSPKLWNTEIRKFI